MTSLNAVWRASVMGGLSVAAALALTSCSLFAGEPAEDASATPAPSSSSSSSASPRESAEASESASESASPSESASASPSEDAEASAEAAAAAAAESEAAAKAAVESEAAAQAAAESEATGSGEAAGGGEGPSSGSDAQAGSALPPYKGDCVEGVFFTTSSGNIYCDMYADGVDCIALEYDPGKKPAIVDGPVLAPRSPP